MRQLGASICVVRCHWCHTRLSAKPGDMAAAGAVATERVCLRVMVQACSEKVADSPKPTGRVHTRAS